MKNIKIIAKEIQDGIINNNLKEELIKMMPYNRQEKCEYSRTLVICNTGIFTKYNLNILSKYPAKRYGNNSCYVIQDKKGNILWKSDYFSIGSYNSDELLRLGIELLKDIKEGDLIEIFNKQWSVKKTAN